ncbi:fasciclin domain-containing protein [Paraflavitalea sp. CAU 1676]|uniref:fasciclin domain-containing protein n=1 Tax=Paraflavitalea sp. CAU 1676 TaxID=3032598 RepID=UPI0023DB6E36|nr:fasciclin domain-containing protein [Paraflavitalea sp. CAU 1676]MDF2192893.1 fasciclin domain-containing protein [Paraflavitalea sp. CAU 1676]
MRRILIRSIQVLLVCGSLLPACQKWDDHHAITDPATDKDLFQQIEARSNLSKFRELLVKSGYDKVIASSKTFTVFAPTDAALSNLDPAVVNNDAKLKMFVANHITNQSHKTGEATAPVRLQMLSEKYTTLKGKLLEDATITEADRYARNGVLQVIDKAVPALQNIWEFIESDPLAPAVQRSYFLSLFGNVYDTTNAVQIGVDPNTGEPIYQPGTDSVRTNAFWRSVYDLREEKKQYTVFLLNDNAWATEIGNYIPLFKSGGADTSIRLASWNVLRDCAIEGAYDANTLPDTVLSRYNTKVGIDKSQIERTIKTSNGTIFIMKKLNVRPVDKFTPIVIQAENYQTVSHDRRNNTYFRDRITPSTGKGFRDVLVYNHGVALFNLGYRLSGLPTIKYKAYWVALHDNINGSSTTFQQKLGIGTATSTLLPYVTVGLNNYDEVYLGEFPINTYTATTMIYLTAANSTAALTNTIVCDYIKLVPVL